MINRELRPVDIITFSETLNSYGQMKTNVQSARTVQMVVKPYINDIVNNPKFNDCELIALTEDRNITCSNSVRIDNKKYDVMYVIPSFRYNQLFLKEIK